MFDDYEDYDPEFEEISLDSFGGVDASNDDFDFVGEDEEYEEGEE